MTPWIVGHGAGGSRARVGPSIRLRQSRPTRESHAGRWARESGALEPADGERSRSLVGAELVWAEVAERRGIPGILRGQRAALEGMPLSTLADVARAAAPAQSVVVAPRAGAVDVAVALVRAWVRAGSPFLRA
jgi:hypothetical protein